MAKIFHADLHGLSGVKDKALLTLDIDKTEWSDINIEASSFYLLIPQNSDFRQEYDTWWKITDIMPVNCTGVKTHRDHFVLDFDKDVLRKRLEAFCDRKISDQEISERFQIHDTRDWKLAQSRKSFSQKNWNQYLTRCLYRPFDWRAYCHHEDVVELPRHVFEKHIFGKDNLCLISVRQVAEGIFNHVFVTEDVTECRVTLSNKGAGYCYPLYLYDEDTPLQVLETSPKRRSNFSQEFLNEIITRFGYTPLPESIFHYIYAILHSPTYRTRYVEFLKGDFPRIPLTRNNNLFCQLAEYGEQLVAMHLMKSPVLAQTSSPFINNGGGGIVDAGHPKYENGKVIINKKQDCFVDVPEAVWNFHVGGYQVSHKWLKDRKGRTLSPDDISHYQKIVVALGQTIELMTKIDEAIPNWPIQ